MLTLTETLHGDFSYTSPSIAGKVFMRGRLFVGDGLKSPLLADDASTWESGKGPLGLTAKPVIPGTLFIWRGLSGSGKTGEVESMIDYFKGPAFGPDHTEGENFNEVNALIRNGLEKALYDGLPYVYLDNSHIKKFHYQWAVRAAQNFNYRVEILYPNSWWREDPIECCNRSTKQTPLGVIERQSQDWEA